MKMKMTGLLAFASLIITWHSAVSQNTVTAVKSKLEPLLLHVGQHKTTNLIFPYSIVSIDRGHRDLLAQVAKGVGNILQIKAASDTLPETNLSVVAADGSFYSFIARFTKNPQVLNLNLGVTAPAPSGTGILVVNNNNEAQVRNMAEAVASRKPFLKRPLDKRSDMLIGLTGLYIKNDMFYWQLILDNSSNVGYDIEQLRFFIRDQKKMKRTASQELELTPTYVYGDVREVPANSRQVIVFAFPKFTIPDRKYLRVELMEQRGGRGLTFKIPNKVLLKAKQL